MSRVLVLCGVFLLGCGSTPSGGDVCPGTTIPCGGRCVDTAGDPFHCGGCGDPCALDAPLCESGTCVATCAAGLTECDGGCFDLAASHEHCGACGDDCGIAEACSDGNCVPGECLGQLCDNLCVDLSQDPQHCGSCITPCTGGGTTCEGGECVPACGGDVTQLDCGNGCEDITTNPDQCGACNVQCGSPQYCVDSGCQCRPGLVQDGVDCVDPSSDPDACGDPPVDCMGGTPLCADGVCVADCGQLDQCGQACVVTETNPLHCGNCGDPCDADEVCVGGQCENFDAPPACTTCPCTECGGGDACCGYPGDTDLVICVNGGACP